MRPIIYRRRFYSVAETFFTTDPPAVDVDVVEWIQAPARVPRARCTAFDTIVIDLTSRRSALWGGMNKETRYEVRRAANRDGITYREARRPDEVMLTHFVSFYDKFTREKRLAGPDPRRLTALSRAGALELSAVYDSDGRELGWHAYYRGDRRTVLLHSASALPWVEASDQRNFLGRANRFHHWSDLVHFQNGGLCVYDLGGRSGSPALSGIDSFKASFGGAVIREWNCVLPRSSRGAVVIGVRRALAFTAARRQRARPAEA
jgi:hypothetical protein